MTKFDLTPDQERKIYDELAEADQRTRSNAAKMSPQLAQNVSSLYRSNPYTNPGAILAAGQAVTSGAMTMDQAMPLMLAAAKNSLPQPGQEEPKKKQGWFDRTIMSRAKTASRWTFATLNFVPQAVTNIISQPFTDNPEGQRGFFISTDLGTMLANDNEAGDGWFMGGKALQMQAERARRYRGTIGEQAFTIGRGAASIFTQPGSREYNILSGLVDAAATIAIPAAPGVKPAQRLASISLGKAGLRTLAGLTDAESVAINPQRVTDFLNTRGGQSIIQRISEVENIDEALELFPGVQDMGFINKVVELKNPTDVQNYLIGTLGKTGPQSIDQINLSRFDDMKRQIGRYSPVARLMESVPGGHVVIQGGNPRDVARSVRNMNQYLKLARVSDEERLRVITNFSNNLVAADGSVYDTLVDIQDVIKTALVAQKVPEQAITDLMKKMKEFVDEKDVYGQIGPGGAPTANGQRIILSDGTVGIANGSSPGLISEQLRTTQLILPDIRRVRRMTSKVGWIYGQTGKFDPAKYGKLRLPFSALEAFQNEIWRPVTLMTGGYVLRNMSDSAFRYTMQPGLKGGIFHPIQWLNIAMYKQYKGTLLGEDFDQVAAKWARDTSREYFDAVGQSIREKFDPIAVARQGYNQNHWALASKASGGRYQKGLMDEVSLLFEDPVAQRIAAGETIGDLLRKGTGFFYTEAGKDYLRRTQRVFSNRELSSAADSNLKVIGTADFVPTSGDFTPEQLENIREFVRAQIDDRITRSTGNDTVLKEAISTGKFTNADGKKFDVFEYSGTSPKTKAADETGKVVDVFDPNATGAGRYPTGYTKEWQNEVQRIIREDAGRVERGEQAILNDFYKYKVELDEVADVSGRQGANIRKSWDKAVNYFFSELYPKRSAYLMQSPAFRQYYYQQVGRLVDELDADGLAAIKTNLMKAAKAEGTEFNKAFISRYVGDSRAEILTGKGLGSKLFDKISNPSASAGKVTLDEMDAYAKGFALDQTKNLFYNASEKSNFADILRVVAPFGSAWAEVMSKWTQIAFSNPESLKRIGFSVQGLRDADPDNDGKGFFWKDPQSGEYVFNFPFDDRFGGLVAALTPIGAAAGAVAFGLPGLVGGAVAGAGAGAALQQQTGMDQVRFTAPAKSLSMGLNIIPGVGPMAQIAASKLLGQIPQADQIRDLILPFGEPDITTIGPVPVPSWGRKVIDSIVGNPDSSRLLGDLMIDTMRVLQTTGNYDLATPEGRQQLEDDSLSRARVLLMLRGLGQFVGPARPEPEFKVETYQGDKYTAELAKAFRVMQQENYDTAVERFLDTFGENAFLYVQSKSRSTVGGLSPSREFGRFEAENGDLFRRYPQVAGYFAPESTGIDYQVYMRQLEGGRRERIKPSEFIEEAQATVGKALYRASLRAAGPYPNTDQRNLLRQVRDKIGELFPGFATAPVDFKKQEIRIDQLRSAAVDPILNNNPIAEGARVYFEARDLARQEAERRGFTTLGGKNVADLRTWLRNLAEQIIAQYPEFERVYDRVLFTEIDIDAGEGR